MTLLTSGGQAGGQLRTTSGSVPNDADVISIEVHNHPVAHTVVTRMRTGATQAQHAADQHKPALSTQQAAAYYGDGLKMYQDLKRRVPLEPVDKPGRWTREGENA